jgi:hypothetical protein
MATLQAKESDSGFNHDSFEVFCSDNEACISRDCINVPSYDYNIIGKRFMFFVLSEILGNV